MTLPLTSEQVAPTVEALRTTGHAWVNVGYRLFPLGYASHACAVCGRSAPPSEWAEAAAAQCDCNFGVRNTGRGEPGPHECPDCRGTGKPIHTLSAAVCETCSDVEWALVGTPFRCPDCRGTGTVTVRYVVAELVRYVARSEAVHGTIFEHGGDYWLHTPLPDGRVRINPIGNPQPGDWVVHLEAVT